MLLASVACSSDASSTAAPAPTAAPPVVLTEVFQTAVLPEINIDSVAVWRRAEPALLLATAKTGNVVVVYEAATGKFVRNIGESGTAAGQLRRPNGILILDDFAFVVERDNHRIQAFKLPGGESVLTFGGADLRRPYGITGYADGDGYVLFITDNYESALGGYPPDAELGARVHRFRLSNIDGALRATHEANFGETSGPGVLRKVETIMADPVHKRLLVAEEDVKVRSLQLYTPDGRFEGKSISGWFATEPEGVAMYACGDDGYWIATDQNDAPNLNVFHVLDRRTLAHVGSFRGAVTRTTDGVTLTKGTLGSLEGGAFFALNNDEQVAAFSWAAIAKALSLKSCS